MEKAFKFFTYNAPLPTAENEVMNVIASHMGPITVHQIFNTFEGRTSMASIYTLCRRLEQRGLIRKELKEFDLGALGKATRTTYEVTTT